VSRHVKFIENTFPYKQASSPVLHTTEISTENDVTPIPIPHFDDFSDVSNDHPNPHMSISSTELTITVSNTRSPSSSPEIVIQSP